MKYSFKKINIEAPFPTTQCGHSCQTFEVTEFKDHLFARAFSIKDDSNWIIHISCDLLAISIDFRNKIQDKIRKELNNSSIHLITSTTHTHYANSVRDDKYLSYLEDVLVKGIVSMEYTEVGDIKSTYQIIKCKDVGVSRISGYETDNEYLVLIRLFAESKCILNWVITNAHPTTLGASITHFFSAEYPGRVLKLLEDKYPDESFTYSLGPSGDISSRFVRKDQTYEAMLELADKLFNSVDKLHQDKSELKDITLDYKELPMVYEKEFSEIDLSNIRNDLSPRELETIKLGQEYRDRIIKSNSFMGSNISDQVLSSWNLGSVKLVFFPNELFSDYLNLIDLNNKFILSYSNGYGPYVLPPDFKHITYEMFLDTTNKKTKEMIQKMIREI